jgi:hypothetical protein
MYWNNRIRKTFGSEEELEFLCPTSHMREILLHLNELTTSYPITFLQFQYWPTANQWCPFRLASLSFYLGCLWANYQHYQTGLLAGSSWTLPRSSQLALVYQRGAKLNDEHSSRRCDCLSKKRFGGLAPSGWAKSYFFIHDVKIFQNATIYGVDSEETHTSCSGVLRIDGNIEHVKLWRNLKVNQEGYGPPAWAVARPSCGSLWAYTTAPLFPPLDLDPKEFSLIVDRGAF